MTPARGSEASVNLITAMRSDDLLKLTKKQIEAVKIISFVQLTIDYTFLKKLMVAFVQPAAHCEFVLRLGTRIFS